MGLHSAGAAAGLVLLVAGGVPAPAGASSGHPSAAWGGADLSVRVAASPRVAQPGQWLSYEVKVRNAGPGDAVLPVLTIKVPVEVDIAGVNVTTCHPGTSRNEVVCPSPVDIPAGGSGAVTVLGMVRPGARGPLRAVAGLTSEVVDENMGDNRAEVVTYVAEGADLGVRLSPSTRHARPGQRFTVTAAVRNGGPGLVRDARVSLKEKGARFLSARGARCAMRRGRVGCALRPIKPGSRGTLSMVFRLPRRGPRDMDAEATVYSTRLGDRRPANNQARLRVSLAGAGRPRGGDPAEARLRVSLAGGGAEGRRRYRGRAGHTERGPSPAGPAVANTAPAAASRAHSPMRPVSATLSAQGERRAAFITYEISPQMTERDISFAERDSGRRSPSAGGASARRVSG